MRILFVSLIPSYWGGSEVLWTEAAAALARRGHAVEAFFAIYREHPKLDALRSVGVRFHYGTPAPMRWWKRLTYRPAPYPVRLRKVVAAFRPDLVILSQAAVRDGVAELQSLPARGVRYAIINQLVEPLYYPDETWRAIRMAYANAERLWFVSTENRESVSGYLQTELENAEVIPNAFACPYDAAQAWPDNDDPVRLALVARLEPEQKGHDLVIDALADPRWRERRLELTFFGDGPGRAQLVARCRHRNVPQVSFVGHGRNAVQIWPTHHAALLPSRFEGQSLAMLEAMLHGRPVIATPVAGTRGLVRDGETGFVAERFDLDAWQAVLDRAWQRRSEWQTLGANAARVARAHVWANPGQEMAEQIEHVVHGAPSTSR